MSVDWDGGSWTCGGAVAAKNFVKATTALQNDHSRQVPQIPKALLALPPDKRPKKAKRLKPDKWRAAFDSEGKLIGFQKLLKLIKSGGVDYTIRAEVWEFLLGCYALGTTTLHREQIRQARRKRYRELIEQCRMMHSSVGTGTLAYTVGSKIMDVRTISKDSTRREAKKGLERVNSEAQARLETLVDCHATKGAEEPTQETCRTMVGANLESTKEGMIPAGLSSLYSMSNLGVPSSDDPESESETGADSSLHRRNLSADNWVRLPIRNPFASDDLRRGLPRHKQQTRAEKSASCNGRVHRDQTNTAQSEKVDSMDKEVDSANLMGSPKVKRRFSILSRISIDSGARQTQDTAGLESETDSLGRVVVEHIHDLGRNDKTGKNSQDNVALHESFITCKPFKVQDACQSPKEAAEDQAGNGSSLRRETKSRRASFTEMAALDPVVAMSVGVDEERVADWLWTLHKIVVDVVRTDRHLEFYGDMKNMARMSDILAVYAWIDPETGYCQGMSDLLSPFIVLFNDDADAFWCFESLLRRVRKNFQMKGPMGVMKQLEALSNIMEVADAQMFKHLVETGSDSFLFAFRMLLVLFRRELTFGEGLYMWEMMWAADFDQAMAWALDYNCLESLVLRIPSTRLEEEFCAEDEVSMPTPPDPRYAHPGSPYGGSQLSDSSTPVAFSGDILSKGGPLCGLKPSHFWCKHRQVTSSTLTGLLGRDGDEELSVFCVAAILVQNRTKLLKDVQSMDDAIKIFNDMDMTLKVHNCVHTAIKLRKKYRTQLAKRAGMERRALYRHQRTFHSF